MVTSTAVREITTSGMPTRYRWSLPSNTALYLLASIIVSFLAGSSAPTPLYETYQAEWGFSSITTTVVFGVYAIAVLAALLTLGKLSDHIGRRPVLLAALLVQTIAMVVFATASDVGTLMAGRIVQGVATGAAAGALGAAMLDIDRVRGTFTNSVAPGIGTGGGALISALAVQFLPAPTHLIYLALIGVFAIQAVGVLLMRETVTPVPGALASLVPEITLPRAIRAPIAIAAPVLLVVWALAGFYGSLAPALLATMTGSTSAVLGGAGLFVLAGAAALAVVAFYSWPPRRVMALGILTLIVGVAGVLTAVTTRSATGFFAASIVAGIGFGSGFQGGFRTVLPLVEPHQRAGVLSLLYVVSYLGLGVPAVAAGFLVVHGGGLIDTAREYGAAIIVVAAAALGGLILDARRVRSSAAVVNGR